MQIEKEAIDLEHLAKYTGGDPALNAEILRLFAGQLRELVEQLDATLRSGDQKGWREITHTLKGAARGVGAFGFADAAADAEKYHPASQQGDAEAALNRLADRASQVQHFIAAYLR